MKTSSGIILSHQAYEPKPTVHKVGDSLLIIVFISFIFIKQRYFDETRGLELTRSINTVKLPLCADVEARKRIGPWLQEKRLELDLNSWLCNPIETMLEEHKTQWNRILTSDINQLAIQTPWTRPRKDQGLNQLRRNVRLQQRALEPTDPKVILPTHFTSHNPAHRNMQRMIRMCPLGCPRMMRTQKPIHTYIRPFRIRVPSLGIGMH